MTDAIISTHSGDLIARNATQDEIDALLNYDPTSPFAKIGDVVVAINMIQSALMCDEKAEPKEAGHRYTEADLTEPRA